MVFLLTLGYNVGSAKLPDAIFETVFASNLEFRSDIRIPYEPLGVTTLQHFAEGSDRQVRGNPLVRQSDRQTGSRRPG